MSLTLIWPPRAMREDLCAPQAEDPTGRQGGKPAVGQVERAQASKALQQARLPGRHQALSAAQPRHALQLHLLQGLNPNPYSQRTRAPHRAAWR